MPPVTFAWPAALVALGLVPLLALLYLLAQRRRRAYTVRFTNLALLDQVMGRRPGPRRHVPPLLFLLATAVLLVSLARPSLVLAVPRDQAAVMLVVDVSGSMAAPDLKPTRLAAAKQAVQSLVAALPANAQVGLVSFNSTASVVAPLSRDPEIVERALSTLTPYGGTAIGDGLSLALTQLDQRPSDAQGHRPPAAVILLSDGESNADRVTPAEAAAQAQRDGIKVYTVGIGERGRTVRLNGRTTVGLDEETLKHIAEVTGGQYSYAAESTQLQQIYQSLGSQVTWVTERTEVTPLVTALGTLLLIVSGLFALRWFQQLP